MSADQAVEQDRREDADRRDDKVARWSVRHLHGPLGWGHHVRRRRGRRTATLPAGRGYSAGRSSTDRSNARCGGGWRIFGFSLDLGLIPDLSFGFRPGLGRGFALGRGLGLPRGFALGLPCGFGLRLPRGFGRLRGLHGIGVRLLRRALGSFSHSVVSLLAAARIVRRGACASVPKAPPRRPPPIRSTLGTPMFQPTNERRMDTPQNVFSRRVDSRLCHSAAEGRIRAAFGRFLRPLERRRPSRGRPITGAPPPRPSSQAWVACASWNACLEHLCTGQTQKPTETARTDSRPR